jgi:hypothetical protein
MSQQRAQCKLRKLQPTTAVTVTWQLNVCDGRVQRKQVARMCRVSEPIEGCATFEMKVISLIQVRKESQSAPGAGQGWGTMKFTGGFASMSLIIRACLC